jgi:hydroxyethylthiazole kinase-like uncharacterized protein yjeF
MAGLPPHTLMQRAGLAVAQLALAIAPHARHVWVACGPGNNGGDGLEAAMHLMNWGKQVTVTLLASGGDAPADAAAALQQARAAGLVLATEPPPAWDLCIDALLGVGSTRAPTGLMAQWIEQMNASPAPVLAVDVPTGLDADTGHASPTCVGARFTLSLLTLKPGLFTAHGRDASGEVWFDDLGTAPPAAVRAPGAWLSGPGPLPERLHASHKGSYGDVAIVGGAPGMTGAALLAAKAALHGGAGRVFVGLLDESGMGVDAGQPELMFRAVDSLNFGAVTVVCGCGGGDAVRHWLPKVFSGLAPVVIDADAITSVANDSQLEALLRSRARRGAASVLTPHPLEAARLLATTATQVQQNRLAAARELVQRLGCTVVLKGSGTVIASPGQAPAINPTGNARLATAGTGDVLAGMIGARLAAGIPAFEAACGAVYQHGLLADEWPAGAALTASALARLQSPK